MRKHTIISLSIAAIATIAVAMILRAQSMTPNQKLRMAETAISRFYIDTVNEDKLVEEAIKGMLESLDPHSTYNTPEETKELNEQLQGNFSGIGISFNITKDTLYVIQTVAGGPSERIGLLAGDRIISVNDTSIAGVKMKNSDIMKRLRGPKGTKVNVKVLRRQNAATDTLDFVITRADIPIYSVDAAYMADPKTGYIRINRFAAETHREVVKAIKDLKRQGMTQLILDLVDNGGGYLGAAANLLGEFLPSGSLVVYTKGLNSPRQEMTASPSGREPLFAEGPLVVMVNQYSASASEITSGAIQDWDRGVIVGRRTFGKGLVQRPMPFPDGSMMRLTVAHYYTPTGRDIQKPYEKGDKEKYAKDILDRSNQGELMHADSIKYIDSLKVETLVSKRPIYGGGGIYPDCFVALDTSENTLYYRKVMAKGLINQFVINYVDRNRKDLLKRYKTAQAFADRFTVGDDMIASLKEMADKESIDYNAEQAERSRPLFAMIIKALIARDIYDNAAYFRVFNRYDPIFKEALRLINSPEEYKAILSGKEWKSDNEQN